MPGSGMSGGDRLWIPADPTRYKGMKIKPIYLVLAFLTGIAGCSSIATDPDALQVTLAADQAAYVSGEPIEARLANDSGIPVSFTWCALGLERLEIEGWAEYPLPPRACALMLNVLEPGHQEAVELTVEEPLPPATYRFLLAVRGDPFERVSVARSEPFTVSAD